LQAALLLEPRSWKFTRSVKDQRKKRKSREDDFKIAWKKSFITEFVVYTLRVQGDTHRKMKTIRKMKDERIAADKTRREHSLKEEVQNPRRIHLNKRESPEGR